MPASTTKWVLFKSILSLVTIVSEVMLNDLVRIKES